MGRIRLQVQVLSCGQSATTSLNGEASEEKPIIWCQPCSEEDSIQDLYDKILAKWSQMYVGYGYVQRNSPSQSHALTITTQIAKRQVSYDLLGREVEHRREGWRLVRRSKRCERNTPNFNHQSRARATASFGAHAHASKIRLPHTRVCRKTSQEDAANARAVGDQGRA